MRPKTLDEVVGQDHLLGEQGVLRMMIADKRPISIILWGPPGSGKTSLARLYAQAFGMQFVPMSAVFSGVADIKKVVKEAEDQTLFNKGVFVFVDEIHRFNKAQQDVFLPYLEKGVIYLVGATTENPSFSLNNALLSRTRVLTLKALDYHALEQLLTKYEQTEGALPLTPEGRILLFDLAQGDGRHLLNLVENINTLRATEPLAPEQLLDYLQRRAPLYDKGGEEHYNLISALHKSIRGSDADAALYWFSRMIQGGEDPLFIARRLIRAASEDIGLADPQALQQAIAGKDAYEMLGSPEGELNLAQVVVYLALAPKSNALYVAYNEAAEEAKKTGQLSPPAIILNAPTSLMKKIGYGAGYIYDHDTPHAFSGQNYFPDGISRHQFYRPVQRGFEREMQKRIAFFERLREKNSTGY